jgi:hypothetical protein
VKQLSVVSYQPLDISYQLLSFANFSKTAIGRQLSDTSR